MMVQHVEAAVNLLKKKYVTWRAVLDDGNSFYRGLFLGFLETCVQTGDGDAVLRLCDWYAVADFGCWFFSKLIDMDCDVSLEPVAGTDSLREWLINAFAKPLLRLVGKISEASLEAIDTFYADNATLDQVCHIPCFVIAL